MIVSHYLVQGLLKQAQVISVFSAFFIFLLLIHVCSYLSLLLEENLVFIQHILIHSSAKYKVKKIKKCFRSRLSLVCVRHISGSPARSFKPLWPEVLIMQILSHLLEILHVSPANGQTRHQLFRHKGAPEHSSQTHWSCAVGKHLSTSTSHWFEHLHKHGAQFEEVVVFWVLHFYHPPGVQTPTDLLSFHLNQLVGANHSKGDAGLKKTHKVTHQTCSPIHLSCALVHQGIPHLQDPGLLFELLILVRVGVRQLVDPDPVLCNLIQDLMMENTKTGWNVGGQDLAVISCDTLPHTNKLRFKV